MPDPGGASRPRRRLPVVQAPRPDDEHAERPGWHWSIVVALGTLFGWLFVEMVVVPPVLRAIHAEEGRALATAIHLAALALPAGGVSSLAGRLGARARAWHAAGGALGLVVLIASVSYLRVGGGAVWAIASALASATAAASALVGFALGRRRPALEA